jgi:hypothetical protein
MALQIGEVDDVTNEQNLSPTQVTAVKTGLGLENVDNTSDADKPVSNAQQSALDDKQDILSEGPFVDGDKTKLDDIEDGAEVNEINNDASTNNTISDIWSGTQAQYDALGTYDNATLYFTE